MTTTKEEDSAFDSLRLQRAYLVGCGVDRLAITAGRADGGRVESARESHSHRSASACRVQRRRREPPCTRRACSQHRTHSWSVRVVVSAAAAAAGSSSSVTGDQRRLEMPTTCRRKTRWNIEVSGERRYSRSTCCLSHIYSIVSPTCTVHLSQPSRSTHRLTPSPPHATAP